MNMKNKINKFTKLSIIAIGVFPFTLLAANPPKDLGAFINIITGIIGNSIIPLIFTLAFAYFIWGVAQYMLYPDDEGKKEKGRQFIVWGLIALTVMFSVWGLVKILTGTFGVDTKFVPSLPQVPK